MSCWVSAGPLKTLNHCHHLLLLLLFLLLLLSLCVHPHQSCQSC
jgi:hypothetical protein